MNAPNENACFSEDGKSLGKSGEALFKHTCLDVVNSGNETPLIRYSDVSLERITPFKKIIKTVLCCVNSLGEVVFKKDQTLVQSKLIRPREF